MQGILYQMHGNAMRDAAGLMAWRGYDNVRASELARAARMSVGTLYRQYGSKRAFALAVRDFMDHELSNFGSHHFRWARGEPEGSFRSAFLVLWAELARVVVSQPALFCFTFLHWHPEDLQPPQAQVTRARALLRDVLTEGEREGALAPGAAKVGEVLVWGALTELARKVAQGAEEVYQEDIIESGEALLRALAPREDSGPRGSGSPPPEDSGPCGSSDTQPGAAGPEAPADGGSEATGLFGELATGSLQAHEAESQAPTNGGSEKACTAQCPDSPGTHACHVESQAPAADGCLGASMSGPCKPPSRPEGVALPPGRRVADSWGSTSEPPDDDLEPAARHLAPGPRDVPPADAAPAGERDPGRCAGGLRARQRLLQPLLRGDAGGDALVLPVPRAGPARLRRLGARAHRRDARGADDQIVSDTSLFDFGFLGQLGAIPGWPGAEVYPPQPMLKQTRAVLDAYREEVLPGVGHSPHLEAPEAFRSLLLGFLAEGR